MSYNYAFFDVDCIEVTPGSYRYNCPERSEPIKNYLYEIYGLISGLNSPYLFTIHEDGNKLIKEDRRDSVFVPIDADDKEWKKSVTLRFKYFLERAVVDDKEDPLLFNSNKNATDCLKAFKAKQWVVFGVGLDNKVDHVITEMIKLGHQVCFIPELIINETANADGKIDTNEVNNYFTKWQSLGAKPLNYNSVLSLLRKK